MSFPRLRSERIISLRLFLLSNISTSLLPNLHPSAALAACHKPWHVVFCLHSVPGQLDSSPPPPRPPVPPLTHTLFRRAVYRSFPDIWRFSQIIHSVNDFWLNSTAVRGPTAPGLNPVPFVDTRGMARNEVCLGQCCACTPKPWAPKRQVCEHPTLTPLHFLST